ncbi:GPCR, PTH11-type [Ilyonectria robusta]
MVSCLLPYRCTQHYVRTSVLAFWVDIFQTHSLHNSRLVCRDQNAPVLEIVKAGTSAAASCLNEPSNFIHHIEGRCCFVLLKLKPHSQTGFPLFSPFLHFHLLSPTEMGSPKIPPEHVYCVQAGKKHHELFTTMYVGANYCGRCGLANPFKPQHRVRSKTPALPGPHDEVVEVEDSPPRPVSPASHLLRDKPKPVIYRH